MQLLPTDSQVMVAMDVCVGDKSVFDQWEIDWLELLPYSNTIQPLMPGQEYFYLPH